VIGNIAHRLNARGVLVSHGANPRPDGVYAPIPSNALELDAPLERDVAVRAEAEVSVSEDTPGTFRAEDRTTVT